MFLERLILIVVLSACFQFAQASSLEDGLAAIKAEDFDVALETLKPLASDGDPAAQYAVGGLYYKGQGMEQDLAAATEWFRRSAGQGYTKAKISLAFMYHYGRSVEVNHEKAAGWYRLAASEGDTNAQVALAVMLDRGQGVPPSAEEALSWMKTAAENGNPVAQHNLGVAYSFGYWIPQDHAKAVQWYKKSAEQNNVEGQYQLGWKYQTGAGVTRNKEEAQKWFQKAWDQDRGHAPARTAVLALDKKLAQLFKGAYDGKYAKPCKAKFETALKRAQQGNAKWQFCTGLKYSDGPSKEGMEKPKTHWLAIFPLQDTASADYYLASANSAYVAATVNDNESVFWLEKAAEQGYVDAQRTVALNYYFGNGIPLDTSRAKYWLRKAIEQGDPTAMEFWGWFEFGELNPDRLAGSFERDTYVAPNDLFHAKYLLGGSHTSTDSFDPETGSGAVSLSNDFGALNGVIYGPADTSRLRDWFHSVPLGLVKSVVPNARILREEGRQFNDMDAWIAVVEMRGGGLLEKHDIEENTVEASDSVRGFVVFRRANHFFALMCEINVMGFYTKGRTFDPENWDEFLTELNEFYLEMKIGGHSQ